MIQALIFGDKYTVWEILANYWPIFPVAFLTSLIATPVCRSVALKLNIVDRPDNKVKTHAQATAYLGGVGIMGGFLVGIFIGFVMLFKYGSYVSPEVADQAGGYSGKYPSWLLLAGIGLGASVACMVGLLDDILDLRPKQKFIGQALAAAILLVVGIKPDIAATLSACGIHISPTVNMILSVPVVLFFILGATNSLNLLDGLDGLCGGVTAIITTALLLVAISLATWSHSHVADPVRVIVALALVGATLGFLPLNRHPAKIFMGDAGSVLLGFVVGTLMILLLEKVGRWSVASIIIFGLPILDTAVALVRRALNKRPLFVSDRGHIYDQLMDRGHSLTKSVKICYTLAALYALIGLAVLPLRFRYSIIVFVLVFAISGLIVWRKGFLKMKPLNDQQSK